MGIKSLLPYLKSITKEISLSDIRGSIVAVDSYSWLHKAALSCSDKLALGEDTEKYLNYCIKYIKLLLLYDIKVILVFDGKNLPAKSGVENARKQNRDFYLKQGLKLSEEDKHNEAKECFDRCIEISHKIASRLIIQAHSLGAKCIVAPYEADAQLAYLGMKHIVDYIITEDSDLIVFGTPKVLFKLDFHGRAQMIEKNDINKVLQVPMEKYSFSKFRHMCIIAGCDYFPGIKKVGLATAAKIVHKTNLTLTFQEFLNRINMYSKNRIDLSQEEIDQAIKADLAFQYQIVFDPIKCEQTPLNDYPIGMNTSDLKFAGNIIEDQKLVIKLAMGTLDPNTHNFVENFEIQKQNQASYLQFCFSPKKKEQDNQKENIDISLSKEKPLRVECFFPWKNASKSLDEKADFSQFLNSYLSPKPDEIMTGNNFSLLNETTSSLESIVSKDNCNDIDDKPFSSNSIIRNKRKPICDQNSQEHSTPKKLDTFFLEKELLEPGEVIVSPINNQNILRNVQSSPVLNSKKILVQSRLSHLFKKS